MTINNNFWWGVLSIILIVGGYYLFFLKEQAGSVVDDVQISIKDEALDFDVITNNLTDKYQIAEFTAFNLEYTLQFQEKLITNKPVLFSGRLDDIYNKNGMVFMRFTSRTNDSDFIWELECERVLADKILKESNNSGSWYAVVANIKDVTKQASLLIKPLFYVDDVELYVEHFNESSDQFIAHGSCVEMISKPRTP